MSGLFLVPQDLIRRQGVLTIKIFGPKYKITWCKSSRKKGYELLDCDIDCEDSQNNLAPVHSEKLSNNISRARSMVYEYAYCNSWDYFITLTISPDKYDRYDLKGYMKDLGKFINNYCTNYHSKVSYLLIPEQHKNGAWHMHGLISGILSKHLVINKNGYLDFSLYSRKFGYCSLGVIKSHELVCKYITKYITKDLSCMPFGQRLYYCSKGLNRSKVLYQFDNIDPSDFPWDYIHPDGYCMVSMVDNLDFLCDKNILRSEYDFI